MEMTEASEVQTWVRELVGQTDENNEAQLLNYLEKQVEYLLETRPQMLAQVLYRLDVDEEKSKAALKLPTHEWAKALAKLMFDREKLRLALWKKYSGNSSKTEPNAFSD